MGFEFTERQNTAVTLRGCPLLVSAAAGAGKTRVLVERIADAVFTHDRHIDDFLVITYTRAAAGELRQRIASALSDRREGSTPGRATKELLRLHRAQIGTIHAFCAALLRRCAVEAGVSPGFKQLENSEMTALRAQALDEALERLYAEQPDGSPFDRLADTLSDTGRDRRLGETVLGLYDSLQALPDPVGWMETQLTLIEKASSMPPEETPWGRLLLEDAARELSFAREVMLAARGAMSCGISDAYGPAFDADLDTLDVLLTACSQGWDAASSALAGVSHTRLKRLSGIEPDSPGAMEASSLQDTRDMYKKIVKKLALQLSGDAGQRSADFESILPVAQGLCLAVRVFSEIYHALKQRRGALDFNDLEHKTRSLLLSGAPIAAQQPFFEVLVDEYQDVNQVQEDIIQALTGTRGNVFMVGDVRQSIYGFRQADPDIFLRKYGSWPEASCEALSGTPKCVTLPHNFRSHPRLLDAVNHIFSKIMSAVSAGLDYGEREALRAPPGFGHADARPRAALYLCDKSKSAADTPDTGNSEACMAAEIIARALGVGGSGHILTVRDGDTVRAVLPCDIALLVRTRGEIPAYRDALSRYGIPCANEEARLFDTLEAQTVLACFQVLDNPRQDVPLLTLLRSPLYDCTPDELSQIRECCGEGDLYDALTASEGVSVKAARLLSDIGGLHELAADASTAQVFHAMLERMGFLRVFGGFPDGGARRHNLLSMVPVVARCDSVSSCAAMLTRLEKTGELLSASGSSADGVKLMTIHKSKGLEFPVTFVAGLSRKFNLTDARKPVLFHKDMGLGIKYTDPETRIQYPTMPREAVARRLTRDTVAEEMRLLYVALTRAKDHLIVSASSNDWEKALRTLTPVGAKGVPHPYQVVTAGSMAAWLVLALNTRDGLCGSDAWSVVRWDGHTTVQPGSEAAALFEAAAGVPDVNASQEYRSPEYPYEASVTLPSKMTVTELKGRLLDAELSEDSQPYAQPEIHREAFPRPRFVTGDTAMTAAERGTALHAALQQVEFSRCATTEGVKAELERLREERRLTDAQLDCVEPDSITGLVNSPLGRRLAVSPEVRRELPFSRLVKVSELLPPSPRDGEKPGGASGGDSILLQGMIDLAFREGGGWIVADFKTNRLKGRDPKTVAATYRLQLEVYADTVTRMTGLPVLQKLIYFTDGAIEVEL